MNPPFKTHKSNILLVILISMCIYILGCARMAKISDGKTPTPSKSSTEEIVAPPRVIFVIDTTESIWNYRSTIIEICQAFLKEFVSERGIDIVLIRLDDKPECVLQLDEAATTEQFWPVFKNTFSTISKHNGGTDQITAMDLVLRYSQPSNKAGKPEKLVLLYFSDMLVEQPVGKGKVFKTWDEMDWSRFKEKNVSAAFYFVSPALRPKLQEASSNALPTVKWFEPNQLTNLNPVNLMNLLPDLQ